MGALTIRGLDTTEAARLKQEAAARGVSVNTLLKQLVREGLDLKPASRSRRYDDLDRLAGTWDEDEALAFAQTVAAFEQVEPEMWR